MQIKRIQLQHFGCLDEFTADLQPGLNVIRGPNESGKSTLHQALLMALMTVPTQNKKAETWRSWHENQWYCLELGFTDRQGNPYQITKDFGLGSQKLVLPSGATTMDRDAISTAVKAVLGTDSMLVTRSTLCVEQDALAEIANGRSEIAQSLESIMTGSEGDVHTQQALKLLDDRISDFRKGFVRHAVSPGPLARSRDQKTNLESRVQSFRLQLGAYETEIRSLEDTVKRLGEIEQELGPLIATRDRADQHHQLLADLRQSELDEERLENQLEQVTATQGKLTAASADLAQLSAVARLTDEDVREIDQLASRLETLREEFVLYQASLKRYDAERSAYQASRTAYDQSVREYEVAQVAYDREQQTYNRQMIAYQAAVEQREHELMAQEAKLQEARSAWQQQSATPAGGSGFSVRAWMVLLALGTLAAIGGVLAFVLSNSLLLGGVLLAIGLALTAVGLWQRSQSNSQDQPLAGSSTVAGLPPAVDVRQSPIAGPSHVRIEAPTKPVMEQPKSPPPPPIEPIKPSFNQERLRNEGNELVKKLESAECDNVKVLDARYARVRILRGEQENAQSRLEALLGANTAASFEEQRREASKRRRDAEEELQTPAMQRVETLTAINYQALESQIAALESEQGELQPIENRLQIKLEQQPVSHETLLQAEDDLAAATIAYARAEERIAVLELTRQVLGDARTTTLKRAQARLGPETGVYLQRLTNGRYRRAWVDADLAFELEDPARPGRRIVPDSLSRGARDQLYMAARLALIDTLFPQTLPPILLDDPFVHFDPQRLASAIEMCCEIGEQRQILLFTCSENYNNVGHHILMPSG